MLAAAAERNRYLDLLRVGSLWVVVLGHWLLTDITYSGGQLSGLDALKYISWGKWLTLPLQVMPVFFLVGGYCNAASWSQHRERGERWADWVRHRAQRLLWPTTIYIAIAALAAGGAALAGAGATELSRAAWFVALHLWFLPVYLLLVMFTPALLAAHHRWGLAVPAAMAAGAGLVDIGVLGPHIRLIGFANYLLVWGSAHQWGFAWRDGRLASPLWRPLALAGAGSLALVGLLAWGPFPVDMIGAGGKVQNTGPPSVALLSLAAIQAGLLIAAEPAGRRLLARARLWRPVDRLNDAAMTIYLWHMAPVIIAALLLYPTGIAPQPHLGSVAWWALRPGWLGVLCVIFVPIIVAGQRLERPPWRPRPCARWAWLPVVLGIVAVMVAVTKIAIGGFAPGGHLPLVVLAGYGLGFVLAVAVGGVSGGNAGAGRAQEPSAVASAAGPPSAEPGRDARHVRVMGRPHRGVNRGGDVHVLGNPGHRVGPGLERYGDRDVPRDCPQVGNPRVERPGLQPVPRYQVG
jgi:fucose 4-O-acetylase-like acetyltransferase